MPIKFSRAKMRVKDINGNYSTAIDVLSAQPLNNYVRQTIQPWVDGTIDGNTKVSISNPAHNNNAKYWSDRAAEYAQDVYAVTEEGYYELIDNVDDLKNAIDISNIEVFGGVGEGFPLEFENGTYQYTASGKQLIKYYSNGYDLTRKVVKSTTFTPPCVVNIKAKNGYSFTVFLSTNGIISSNTGLITEYTMFPGQQYGITLRTTDGTDDISDINVSSIVNIDYVSSVDDLKSAIKQETNNSIDGVFVIPQGYLEQGSYSAEGIPINNPVSTKRIRTKYPAYVKSGSTFMFTSSNKCREIYWFFFKDSGELETSGNWVDQVSKTLIESGYLLFVFRYDSSSTSITPSNYDARVIIKTPMSYYGAELSNVDAEINSFHNLINYDYDKIYDLAPTPGVTSASAVGIKREKNVFTLNTTNAPSDIVKIKICGDMMRTMSSGTVDDWNGITLTQGHTYLIKSIPISGTSTAVTPNAISVYKHGSHASIGNSWIDGTIYYREFTYDDGTVNLAYVVASGATYTDYKCLVTLEDITGHENDRYDLPRTIVDDYDATISTNSQGANAGIKLKVVSYNVAAYNNDTEVYISTSKEINFKKMLCEIAPDILAIQEDKKYITGNSGRLALTSLYNPIFPYEYHEQAASALTCTVRSKTPAVTHELLEYSTGRWIEVATYEINGKTLLFGSTHPVANYNQTGIDSEESIAARLVQYQELVKWLNGEITLNRKNSSTPVSCPAYDWCVMCGDYNTITATDMTNFKTIATNGGFKIANGDWLGWIETNYKFFDAPMCLDNVMVSDNVIFNSIISHSEMFKDLYSDHVPFEVTVTLQDE